MRPSIVGSLTLAALLLAPIDASPAAGDKVVRSPGGIEYVVPAGSPVGKATFATGDDISATFAGKFVLSGTFHAGADGIAFLKPDAGVAAHLPRWKESGAPREIWFENGEAAVHAIMPRGGGGNSIASAADRHVVLDVDRYTIHIECDTASYYVRFLSVHQPGAVAQEIEQEGGC